MAYKLLIMVDVQKDFDKGGALPYGYPEESNTDAVIKYATDWIKDQPSGNPTKLLCVTKDTHNENYANTLEGKLLPVPHCIKDTEGWGLVDEGDYKYSLSERADWLVLKNTFGTFAIADEIRKIEKDECEEVKEITLIGYDLSICVLAQAVILRAAFPNKRITVLKDLCGDVNKESFDAALTVLKNQQIEIV